MKAHSLTKMECSIPEKAVLLSSGKKSFSSWDNLRPQDAKLRRQDTSREENWVNSGRMMPSEPNQRNQKHTWCYIPAWAHAPEWLMQGRPETGVSESLLPYLQPRDLIHLQSSTFSRAATATSSRIPKYSENLRSLYLSSMNWFYSDWRQPDICCTLAHAYAGRGAHSKELQGRLGQKIHVARTDWQVQNHMQEPDRWQDSTATTLTRHWW